MRTRSLRTTSKRPATSCSRACSLSELGGYLLGRRLYETMLVWETEPSMRDDELGTAFADAWCAIPKVVFSRALDLIETRTFGSRVIYERYGRARAL